MLTSSYINTNRTISRYTDGVLAVIGTYLASVIVPEDTTRRVDFWTSTTKALYQVFFESADIRDGDIVDNEWLVVRVEQWGDYVKLYVTERA